MDLDSAESLRGFQLTEQVINSQSVDGLFCYNDLMAIGALRALHRAGLKTPDDVKVIGFDNIPVGEFLPISLATVAQPGLELVDAAMKLTLDKLENFDREAKCISFPAHFIARETCPIAENSLRKKIFAKAE
jgi:LacI family transcriptional regulator